MPITYDIKTDILYQQGMQQGIEEGAKKEKFNTAYKLLSDGLSVDFVSRVTGLSISEIRKLHTNREGQ
jgi:predicted transposase/invertase (TIGR01784 family)